MGMREDIQVELAAAFEDDLADTVRAVTIFVEGEATYNATTGESTDTYTEVTGRGILSDYVAKKNEPEDLQSCSKRLLVLLNEVSVLTVNGQIEIGTERYEVKMLAEDPAGATAEAYLRRLE